MLKATLKFKSYVKDRESDIANVIERSVGKALLVMERNIKVNTPIRTGTLARSITSRKTGFGKGEVHTASIDGGKEINYAVFVEYGTQHQAPRGMFRKGVAQSEEKIQQIFAEEAKNAVK